MDRRDGKKREPRHRLRRVFDDLVAISPSLPFLGLLAAAASLVPMVFLWSYYDTFGFSFEEVGAGAVWMLPRITLGPVLILLLVMASIAAALLWFNASVSLVRSAGATDRRGGVPAPASSRRSLSSFLLVSTAGTVCAAFLGSTSSDELSPFSFLVLSTLAAVAFGVEWLAGSRAPGWIALVAALAVVVPVALLAALPPPDLHVPDWVLSGVVAAGFHTAALSITGAVVLVQRRRRPASCVGLTDHANCPPVLSHRTTLQAATSRPALRSQWHPYELAVVMSAALLAWSPLPALWAVGQRAAATAITERQQTFWASMFGVDVPPVVVVFDVDEDVVCPQPEDRQVLHLGRHDGYTFLYDPGEQRSIRTTASVQVVSGCER